MPGPQTTSRNLATTPGVLYFSNVGGRGGAPGGPDEAPTPPPPSSTIWGISAHVCTRTGMREHRFDFVYTSFLRSEVKQK